MSYVTTYDTEKEHDLAKQAMQVLNEHYPGWKWWVLVKGGIIQIKIRDFSGKWGMVRKLGDIQHDALRFKRNIIFAAGEFLERAHLRRTGWHDAIHDVKKVEGIPQKDFRR